MDNWQLYSWDANQNNFVKPRLMGVLVLQDQPPGGPDPPTLADWRVERGSFGTLHVQPYADSNLLG